MLKSNIMSKITILTTKFDLRSEMVVSNLQKNQVPFYGQAVFLQVGQHGKKIDIHYRKGCVYSSPTGKGKEK